MTTPVFQVNGVINIQGVKSNWQRVEKRRLDDGTIEYQDYLLNVWDIDQETMSVFLALQALSGKTLTSLATTDVTDRNEAATYNSGVEMGVVNCQQIGQRATGIRVEYRVKI